MNTKLLGALAASTLIVGCAGGSQSSNKSIDAGEGYAGSAGSVLMAGGGGCVRTGNYSSDLIIAECDPEAAAKADAAAAAKAAADKAAADAAAKAAADAKAAAAAAAAAAASADANKAIEMTLSGKTLFATGSTEINAEGTEALNDLASQLASFEEVSEVTITGHADERGDPDFNLDLSERRAEAVKDLLVDSGVVTSSQVTTVGMGESDPAASNDDAGGRQLNRRVEVTIKGMR